jgi:ribosome-associated heat shock protein Hsp15
MRLDQWLWTVRLYRTRSLAQAAIKDGHVTVETLVTKPAREVRAGETVAARTGDITRTYRVVGFPKSRVSAKLVPEFAEDLTPPEVFVRLKEKAEEPGSRPRGLGRPTKRDRRQLERWNGEP